MPRLLLFSLVCAVIFGQERLINFHVVALDRNNQPVANLTADDFEIQEQGKPLRIALFRSVDPKGESEGPLGPQEFSNRSGPATPAATVVLFDLVNRIDERLARTQLTKAIGTLRPQDPVYYYILLGKGLFAVRGLPQEQAVQAGPLTPEQFEAAFARAKQLNIDYQGPDLFEMTYQALQSLAARLAGIPGRKSIVWISSGIPISIESPQPGYSRDYTASENRLTAALQRGNVAMYPVGDSRRVIGGPNMGMLTEIADRSGGRAHMDMDVGAALQQAIQDSRASYTLGFSPRLWDGKYHKVRVACTRAGVRVVAPDGYNPFATSEEDEGRLIQAAQTSLVDAAEIGIRASVGPSQKNPQGARFAIRIQTGDLQLMTSEAGFSGDVSVTMVAYDTAGKPSILKQSGYPFHMTADQHRDALRNGTKVSPDLALKDDVRNVRIIVCDRYSGAVGSLTVPVEHH